MTDSVLGRTVSGTLEAHQVEWWDLPANVTTAEAEGNELQAVCPVTNQPDIYDFVLRFERREPESKALKMYLLGFRDEPISCAALAGRIAAELAAAGGTTVVCWVKQQTRGGLRLSATATSHPEPSNT